MSGWCFLTSCGLNSPSRPRGTSIPISPMLPCTLLTEWPLRPLLVFVVVFAVSQDRCLTLHPPQSGLFQRSTFLRNHGHRLYPWSHIPQSVSLSLLFSFLNIPKTLHHQLFLFCLMMEVYIIFSALPGNTRKSRNHGTPAGRNHRHISSIHRRFVYWFAPPAP